MMGVFSFRMRDFACGSCAAILLTCSAVQVHGQAAMSAQDAINAGLESNFDIQIARNLAEIAENNRGQGTAGLLPSVNGSAGMTYARSEQETNSPFSFGSTNTNVKNAQISLDWTLFDGFSMFVEKARFKDLSRLESARTRNAIESMVVSILRGYFSLVQQELLLDVATATADVSRDRLERERVRNRLGGASKADLLNAIVAFNNDSAAVLNQEQIVETARQDLNILLGREPDSPLSVREEIQILPLDTDVSELSRRALERSSSMQVARSNSALAQRDIAAARSRFLPRLLLNANYGYIDTDITPRQVDPGSPIPGSIASQSTDGSIGLTLSMNLFNGGRDKIAMQNARLNAANQEMALRRTELEVASLVREKYTAFTRQQRLVQLSARNVQAATEQLALQQERRALGTATSLEFRDAQINLSRAESALIDARYTARITRLELDQLTGSLAIE